MKTFSFGNRKASSELYRKSQFGCDRAKERSEKEERKTIRNQQKGGRLLGNKSKLVFFPAIFCPDGFYILHLIKKDRQQECGEWLAKKYFFLLAV